MSKFDELWKDEDFCRQVLRRNFPPDVVRRGEERERREAEERAQAKRREHYDGLDEVPMQAAARSRGDAPGLVDDGVDGIQDALDR